MAAFTPISGAARGAKLKERGYRFGGVARTAARKHPVELYDPSHPDPDGPPLAVPRVLGRAAADYLLRALAEVSALFSGDLNTGVIFLAIARASVPVRPGELRNPHVGEDGVVPDHARRPITTLAVANSLRMPRETVRRHINRLIELGYCERTTGRRIVVTANIMRRPEIEALLAANHQHLVTVLAPMRRAGLF